MGFIIHPDGRIETETASEALDLQAEILRRKQHRSEAQPVRVGPQAGGPTEPGLLTTRQQARLRRQQRAKAVLSALRSADHSGISSQDFAKAVEAEVGRGIGAVLTQVRKAIAELSGISADSVIEKRPVPRTEGGGFQLVRGKRFFEALTQLAERAENGAPEESV